jgi:large subunit ribosomal protein L24
MKIRTGDTVRIMAGKDKGKQGRVLRVLQEKNRVVVEGANMRVRHIRKTPNQPGQRLTYEASLHISNVSIIDPKTKKPTRVGYKIDEKTGNKFRVARGSGDIIKAAATASAEKAPKTAKTDKGDKPAKEAKKSEGGAPPTKQPFWKRAFTGETAEGDVKNANPNEVHPVQPLHRTSRESS